MKNEKTAIRVTGIALYIAAALFCICLLLGFFDNAMGQSGTTVFSRFGAMLSNAYGLCSLLIPLFLLVAGTFCFSAHWTYQKAVGLLVSILPFFTLVFAEKWSRQIALYDYSPIALVKIISLLVISVLVVIAEYLIALVIAGKIHESKGEPKEKPVKVKKEKTRSHEVELSIEDETPVATQTETVVERSSADEDEIDREINASVDKQMEQAASSAWTLKELLNENNRILNSVNNEEKPKHHFEVLSSEDSQDDVFDFDSIPDESETPVTVETTKPAVSESAPAADDDVLAWQAEQAQSLETEAYEEEPVAEEPETYETETESYTEEPVVSEPVTVSEETESEESEPQVEESEPEPPVAFQKVAAPSYNRTVVDDEGDWDSFEMQEEDDEDDIIADFERANREAQEEQEEAVFDIPFEEAVEEEPPAPEEKEKLPFKKGSGVEEEPKNSMFSALDSVFAKMDADAKKDVETGDAPVTEETAPSNTEEKEKVVIRRDVPKKPRRAPYKISTDLLTAYEDNPYWVIDEETKQAAENLKETLSEFKIEAEITDIVKGPVVTMFELLPASGVKLSRIVALQDNIALRLAASSVRIVAPIPGKRAVGIEVPNIKRAIVSFRECIEQNIPEWKKMGVPVVLGKDIEGRTQVMDLVKTPHLLIAGSTGAGKSVCINNMILSILYKRNPNEVKLILIDPKIVELKLYNDIPHLLTPVITEPKRAMQSLQYALCEMERRYALLDGLGVRDISSYNKRVEERKIATEKLPYLVIVIDEFADLMATTGKQLESVVARLAAMSRAVGIHLVLATQRPSIDVITGLIKANIPSRIAFMVASKTDSRIIIDQVGAEKLLGKGDMLYASATDPFPVRIQGAFVTDQEVEDVVAAVKEWGEPEYIDDEIFVDDDDDESSDQMSLFSEGGEDPLYEKALDIVVQAGKASASYIQRKLKIGYNRAARLVEEMEERGIVGPANGSKPRDIIHMP